MDSVIRGISIYAVLLIATRLSGRRTMAQMTPFDFVLLRQTFEHHLNIAVDSFSPSINSSQFDFHLFSARKHHHVSSASGEALS